jgi:hypothetical protein
VSWDSKLDPRLRALVAQGTESANLRVGIFIRFTGSVESLRAPGLELRSVVGDIATAWIAVREVPTLAKRNDVVFLEMSRPQAPSD